MEFEETKRHQLLQAIRILSSVVQFSEKKFDFSSDDGKEILAEAKEACKLLEAEIQLLFPKS